MDLELATLDEITEELARRNSAVLILTLKDARNAQNNEAFEWTYRGGFCLAIGMLTRTLWRMQQIVWEDNARRPE